MRSVVNIFFFIYYFEKFKQQFSDFKVTKLIIETDILDVYYLKKTFEIQLLKLKKTDFSLI